MSCFHQLLTTLPIEVASKLPAVNFYSWAASLCQGIVLAHRAMGDGVPSLKWWPVSPSWDYVFPSGFLKLLLELAEFSEAERGWRQDCRKVVQKRKLWLCKQSCQAGMQKLQTWRCLCQQAVGGSRVRPCGGEALNWEEVARPLQFSLARYCPSGKYDVGSEAAGWSHTSDWILYRGKELSYTVLLHPHMFTMNSGKIVLCSFHFPKFPWW